MSEIYPVGATYAPLPNFVSSKHFFEDLKRMKDVGFTILLSWAFWSEIEKEHRKYNFTELDEVIESADKVKIKTVLTLDLLEPPAWFIREYVEEGVVNYRGESVQPKIVCPDNPKFRELGTKFIEKVVNRYKSSPILHSWISCNEPIIHCSELTCYCRYTINRFREWLNQKRGTLQEVNREWKSHFTAWDEIYPPKTSLREWGCYPAWIDWRNFSDDKLADLVRWISETIKQIDDKHPTQTNLLNQSVIYNPTIMGSDVWKMSESVDILGCSIYILSNIGDFPHLHSHVVDMIRSSAEARGKTCWITEMQGGPTIWGQNRAVTPSSAEIYTWIWQGVLHGAKGFIYWLWRPRVGGWEGGEFGLAGKDGTLRDRAIYAGKAAKIINKNAGLFLESQYNSEVAILHSQTCMHVAFGEIEEEASYYGTDPYGGERRFYTQSILGAYKILWDENIPTDFISPNLIKQGRFKKYKVLIMPFTYLLSKEVANCIKQFVQKGGTIIADFACGMKNQRGEIHCKSPGYGLDEIFGATQFDIQSPNEGNIRIQAVSYTHLTLPTN